MTAIHASPTKVLIDGFDMTGFFDDLAMEASQAMDNHTVFGNSAENFLPGLKTGKASGQCFLDDTSVTGSIAVMKARYGATPGTGIPAAITKSHGTMAVGGLVDMGYFDTTSLVIKDLVADLQKMTFNAQPAANAIDFGVCLHTVAAETSLPFSGTTVDNSVASTNGGVGVVHCTAIAGASPNAVFKIQHSTNGTVWVDLITFTAITASRSVRRVEVTGTINRYLRETITEGGTTSSVTAATGFARR